ncbi:MAG: tRNA (N6-isopentenyl adenosine(37)-C2)-methylthiotransferase MiaB [Oscillospiraceae bacterium]|nr:tRNA (N6-isopentenyl adenosine(37)-C2)-methylthiotransferase MiaB [Oscillospiraceae bacterium]
MIHDKKKACVITFGCQQNESDSEKIKGLLDCAGYEILNADMTEDMSGRRGQFTGTSRISECSVIIMNTCAVREHAELKALSRIGQLKHYKNKNKDILIGVCGCLAEQPHIAEKIKKSFPYVDFIFGTREIHRVPEILNRVITEKTRVFERNENDINDIIPEDLPILRENKFQAKVSIMYGCDNFCSYCVVPYVRGRERSRAKEKILTECAGLAADGCRDILLLGQNVNSYRDPENSNYRFTDLINDIAKIKGNYLLRFLTSHPKDVSGELIGMMGENKKLAKHFHLPVQAGSDRILELMNRKYTRAYYLDLVHELKEKAGDTALSSDIIVGFPSETEQEFEDTLDLVARAEFDNIFPFIYSKRLNTPAEKMRDDVSREEKTERFKRLLKLQNEISLKKNKAYEGKIIRVLVESEYKNMGAGWLAGRNSQHKLAAFKSRNKDLIGEFADIKITEGKLHGLYGEEV